MNKNGDLAAMYETIPAVSGLNRVEGFDPFSLLGRTVSPVTGEEGMQLGLAYKKLWFRLAYPKGRLQMNRVSLTEQTAVFEAQVYLDCSDANPVSSFVSGCAREDIPGGRYIQAAQYEAMDVALTDAGFGLQFADVCADAGSGKEGENTPDSGAGDAVKGKNPARSAATAGAAPTVGNMGHAGNMVRPFPLASAESGTKKAPAHAQGTGAGQPVQAAAMPHGQAAPAGAGQPVQTAAISQRQAAPAGAGQPVCNAAIPQNNGRQPAGTRQPIQAAVIPHGQAAPAGTRQPVQAATIQQRQAALAGTRQPIHAAAPAGAGQPIQVAIPQGHKVQSAAAPQGKVPPTAGTGQPIQVATSQGQPIQTTGAGQGVPPVLLQEKETPPAGSGLSARTVMLQSQGMPPAGDKLPVSPGMPQKQDTEPVGSGLPVQAVMPQGAQQAGKKQSVPPAMPQSQGTRPDKNGNPAHLATTAAPESAAPGKSVPGGSRTGETVKDNTESGVQAVAQNLAAEQGKAASSAGAAGNVRPAKGQRYFGNTKTVSAAPHSQLSHPAADSPAAPQGQSVQLPVPPVSLENKNKETVQPAADPVAGSMNTLPIPLMGKGGQTGTEAVAADTLPVTAGSPGRGKPRSSVEEAMALLRGQTLPAGASEDTAESSRDSTAENIGENAAAASMEAASSGDNLPVNGETAQGEPAPRYTSDMSVEEIAGLMTLEEAGKVVVDTGVSKGQTIAEVAERRPPSLKFYRYGGYKGPNNILRAAAQVMLDSIEGQKAG